VLSCKEDRSNGEIAQQLRITPQTVSNWRGRFAHKRLDGLLDEPRPGAPRTIEDAVVEKVMAKTLHEKPVSRQSVTLVVVAAGNYEALHAMRHDPQIASRFEHGAEDTVS
jgi:transposase